METQTYESGSGRSVLTIFSGFKSQCITSTAEEERNSRDFKICFENFLIKFRDTPRKLQKQKWRQKKREIDRQRERVRVRERERKIDRERGREKEGEGQQKQHLRWSQWACVAVYELYNCSLE